MPIHDITLTISPELPVWPGDPQVSLPKPARMARGDTYTLTRLDISAHTGTHLDAPAHFIADGAGVETLDLNVLIGPALVVDAGDADLLTAEVLQRLPIPAGAQRVLFKTRSSALWDRAEDGFVEDFVAVSGDGAQWLVDRGVRLVGIDYLSIGDHDAHVALLGAGVVALEGLDLRAIDPGEYELLCLPVRFIGSDGAVSRAVLRDLEGTI